MLGFINDQFFLEQITTPLNRILSFFGITETAGFKAHHLLVYYTLLAAIMHYYSCYLKIKHQRTDSNPIFEKTSYLICYLILVFGIGVVSFIEPWVMYMKSIDKWIIGCSLFYILFGLTLYLFIDKKSRHIGNYKRIAYTSITLLFLASCYPSFDSEKEYVFHVFLFASILLLLFPFIRDAIKGKFKAPKKNKVRTFSLFAFELTVIFSSIYFIHSSFISKVLEKSNKSYFELRLDASDKISDQKLFPLFHVFNEGKMVINSKKESLTKQEQLALTLKILRNNHNLANYLNGRSSDDSSLIFTLNDSTNTSDSVYSVSLSMLLEENPKSSVRAFFFKKYLEKKDSVQKDLKTV